ncbi:MAG: hypothetical protein QNL43_03075 [Crocinitomicaceae bacterium]|jgi:hypothetical protein|tara:strand:- start:1201 stop:2037 length:837 start_codon:yes stop_codon:yes gene_type:complete
MKNSLLFFLLLLTAGAFSQNVNIPDANFKAYLVDNIEINTNGDSEIQVSEASSFNSTMYANSLSISDLTGIEAFTALTLLKCNDNQLTSLDVSQNISLTSLNCNVNQLTSLNLNQNIALISLNCNENQITSLDLSQNMALEDLSCGSNQLTSLDVSQNTALYVLWCPENQLSCLNVSNGNNINFWQMYASDNPDLSCIEVDDENWATTNWGDDSPISYSEDCNNDCSTSTVGITEITSSKTRIQILDMLGRETSFQSNTPLIYVYDDGSTEKVYRVSF